MQAEEYRRARNQEQLYLMLLRYASLVLDTIPKHREYRRGDSTYQSLREASIRALSELERLKVEIKFADRAAFEEAPYLPTSAPGAVRFGLGSGINGNNGQQAAPASPADMAALDNLGTPGWDAMMAAQETPSIYGAPQTSQQQQQPVLQQRTSGRLLPMPDLTPSIALPPASNQMLSKHALMASLSSPPHGSSRASYPGQQHYGAHYGAPPPPPTSYGQTSNTSTYTDLLASLNAAKIGDMSPSAPPMPSPYTGELQLGPQELSVHTAPYPTGPLPPGATCCQPGAPNYSSTPSNMSTTTAAPFIPPQGDNSQSMIIPPSASKPPVGGVAEVRKRQRIRDVHLSASLMKEFLRYAESNTRRGIETCGILAGSLSPDDARFTITALIVPKQEGTTDTVQALAEEEIFEAQDSRSLYPLGWIHTHPTQSCFLSSVDVHTHCGYQTMLDEAVAIVMAPSQSRNQMGVFRLTTPGGLSLIQQCELRGFHAHPKTETGQPLYEECSNVYLNERIGYEVIDLRKI